MTQALHKSIILVMKRFLSILFTLALLVTNFITPQLALAVTHDQPVTTANFSSVPDFEGKYPNPVTVTLSATAAAGYLISQTYYTLDGGSQQTYTSPFTVSGSGNHNITYWSVDNAGLGEDSHSQTITLRHQGIHIDSAEWVNETTVRFHYSQNTYAPGAIGLNFVLSDGSFHAGAFGWSSSQESGYVDFVAHESNDLYWGAESGYTRYYAITGGDFADRSNIIRLPAYVAPPHDQPVTTSSLSPDPLSNGEYPSTVTVSLNANAASGYLIDDTYYTIDGGSQQTYTAPFTVSGGGNHTITYWSVDNSGLGESPQKSQTFTIKQQALHIDSAEWLNETTIRFHYSGNAHPGDPIGLVFTQSDGTFHAGAGGFTAVSQESGYGDFVAHESNDLYWGAEAGYTRYYALANADGQSTNIIRLEAYVAPPHSQPVTAANLSSAPDAQGNYSNPVTVTLSATAASGYLISQTYYTIDGGSQQTYSSPFTVSGSGNHTITYWSVDNSGLEETPHKTQTLTLQNEGVHIDSAEWISETTIRFHYSQNTYAPGSIGLNFVLSDGSFHAGAFGWSSSQESGYVDFVAREYNDLYWGAEAGYTRYYAITGGDFADRSNIIRLAAYVPPSNQAPFLDPIGNKMVAEGQTLQFTVSAIDADGDTLFYSATNLPPGATFNPFTRVFTWTPDFMQEGNYPNVEFTVTDDGNPMELDTELITITVGNVNRAPVFDPLGSQEVLEEQLLTFNVNATDPDGDAFVLSAENLPSGSSFDSQAGTFSWTPTLSQAGNYVVTFKTTDNGAPFETGTLEVAITVGDNPTPTEQADNISTTVVNYDFPTNVENSYLANLKKVATFIEQGKIQPAINQLNAFISKVNADYANGIISQEEHDNLIALAQALLNDLQ